MDLSGFSPATWTGVGKLVMDVYISPSLTAGTTVSQFYLAADSDSAGQTNQYIGGAAPVTASANSVTIQISFAPWLLNNLVPADHLSVIHFVYNTSATVTGSFYMEQHPAGPLALPLDTNTDCLHGWTGAYLHANFHPHYYLYTGPNPDAFPGWNPVP